MSKESQVSIGTVISIFSVALLAFAGILSETSMNVTFSHLKTVFHVDLGTLQWITTGYLLAMSISITLGATLSRNFKERSTLFTALTVFAIGNAVAMFAANFSMLMVGRILQGLAAGVSVPLMFNIIVERIPKRQLGFYMGLSGLVISLAPAFGPTYGGVMIAHFDWHMIFTLIFPVPIISFFLSYFFLKNSDEMKVSQPFDWISFLLLSIALSSSLVTISSLKSGTSFNFLALTIFLVTFVGFIISSLRVEVPLLDIRILKNPLVFLGIIPFTIYQFSNLSINFLLPNILVASLGLSSSLAGFALFPGTIMGSLFAPFLGKLYDNKGPKLSLYGGNIILLVAVFSFAFLIPYFSFGIVAGIYIFFTMGRNMSFNNTMALSASLVERKKAADLTAIFQMAQTFAGALGTSIAAVIVNKAPDMLSGGRYVFVLISILILINFICFQRLFKEISLMK